MLVPLVALAIQLQVSPTLTPRAAGEDSLRALQRAHSAQASFERDRRNQAPWASGSGGRCDVRVGQYCWWYDGETATPPEEPAGVGRRRAELLAELDALGARHPGDPWIAGMRVHYRVDARQPALADSAARECRASPWWCTALRAWAAHARGDVVAADSGFAAALGEMPDSTQCRWRDIAALLPDGARGRYERQSCAERAALEERYWMLATPRLSLGANEWRAEFRVRRLLTTLLATAVTPHRLRWERDVEELTLRYGWPIAWSRITQQPMSAGPPDILGHDPSPSFHYAPNAALLEAAGGAGDAGDDAWDLTDLQAPSRYAHPVIRRLAGVSAQLARFRRGDSTLLVAAWAASDDSLRQPAAALGAMLRDGTSTHVVQPAAGGHGQLQMAMAGVPLLAGVELLDIASGTFARSRIAWSPRRDSTALTISDLLLYRPLSEQPPDLSGALARAIPGDTVSRDAPLGLYWEAYGVDSTGTEMETTVLVERTDHGLFRAARQRLGLADPDSPIQVRWNEPAPSPRGTTARALSLDLSGLPPGRYRVTLAVTPAAGAGVRAAREIRLR